MLGFTFKRMAFTNLINSTIYNNPLKHIYALQHNYSIVHTVTFVLTITNCNTQDNLVHTNHTLSSFIATCS